MPWGEWSSYPYEITHKEKKYLRLYLGRAMKTIFFVDGKKVQREQAESMLPKSKPSKKPECITIKEDSLISLRQNGKELITNSIRKQNLKKSHFSKDAPKTKTQKKLVASLNTKNVMKLVQKNVFASQ